MARVFFGAVVRKNSIQHHAASDIYCVARQEPVSIGRDSRRGASTTADTLEQLRFMRSRSSAEFSRGRHLLLRGGQLAKLSEETESLNQRLGIFLPCRVQRYSNCGKQSLIAEWLSEDRDNAIFVCSLAHFVGASGYEDDWNWTVHFPQSTLEL